MKSRTYIGIDNGTSGSVGILFQENAIYFQTPTMSQQDYTKAKKNITRIDTVEFTKELQCVENPFVLIERPMVNPARFNATMSAMRAVEATLVVLELLKIPHQFIDSKEWQKALLPAGIRGSEELKKASLDVGRRLFPQLANQFKGDADGILIAEHARRKNY